MTFPTIRDHLGNTSEYIHILQKENWDCVLACAAMWAKKGYEEVMDIFIKLGHATFGQPAARVFKRGKPPLCGLTCIAAP